MRDIRAEELAWGQATGALPAAVSEAFSLIAEIVVEKTKRNGLAMVKERLEKAICEWEYTQSSSAGTKTQHQVLPALCDLVKTADLEQLAGQGETIRAAVAADLLMLADAKVRIAESGTLTGASMVLIPAARTALTAAFEVVSRPDEKINPDLAWLVADSIINATWEEIGATENERNDAEEKQEKKFALMKAGLYVARAHIAAQRMVEDPPPIPETIRILLKNPAEGICKVIGEEGQIPNCISTIGDPLTVPADFQRIARWATLAVEAASAYEMLGGKKQPDVDRQLRASIELVFKAAEAFAQDKKFLGLVKSLTIFALDGNYVAVTVALGEAAKEGLVDTCTPVWTKPCEQFQDETEKAACEETFKNSGPGDKPCEVVADKRKRKECKSNLERWHECEKRVGKAAALLTAIVGYARTFEPVDSQTTEEEKAALAAERRQARKDSLEGLIDATTDRTNRGGEWVVSLGANLGYLGLGVQRLQNVPDGEDPDRSLRAQLALPLGIAFQRLPRREGDWRRVFGFHSMLTILDIGQYVAWDEELGTTDAEWGDLASPGVQVGVAVGKPDNFFTLGGHASYAPSLFDVEMGTDTERVGALRYGLFVQYFVPLFDFN
jgi:hypothetical protein